MFNTKMLNKKVMVASALVAMFAVSAQAKTFTAVDQSVATGLCVTAVSGNRAAMYNEMRNSGLSKQFIARNVQCNGENIVSFVAQNGRNSENMIKTLGGHHEHTTITDLAMNTVKSK